MSYTISLFPSDLLYSVCQSVGPSKLLQKALFHSFYSIMWRNQFPSCLLSHFSHVWLCATPWTAAHQAPPVPGILQERTLEWVAISFSNAWKWKAKVKLLSRVQLSATPWTAAQQAPLSMGFSRLEYWSGVPSPSPHLFSSHPFFLLGPSIFPPSAGNITHTPMHALD